MLTPGWRLLFNTHKAHWFATDGRSECGKWLFLGSAAPADTHLTFTRDTCKSCARKLGIIAAPERTRPPTTAMIRNSTLRTK